MAQSPKNSVGPWDVTSSMPIPQINLGRVGSCNVRATECGVTPSLGGGESSLRIIIEVNGSLISCARAERGDDGDEGGAINATARTSLLYQNTYHLYYTLSYFIVCATTGLVNP